MLDLDIGYALNEDAVEKGIWRELDDSEAQVRVRSVRCEAFKSYMKRLPDATQRKLARNKLSDKKGKELMVSIIAETLLVDWKGVGRSGKELPFTLANAKLVLAKLDLFREEIWDMAADTNEYGMAAFEEDEGNLLPPSSSSASAVKTT